MAYQLKPLEPAYIPNTTMQKRVEVDDNGNETGVIKSYRITPIAGYVLHDNARDWTDTDPDTGEEVRYRGYTAGTASCSGSYDFTANSREFYAVPAVSVPEDQIFGGVNSNH